MYDHAWKQNSKESLMESNAIEEQLMTALAAQDLPRCIVLIHVSNNHYMYISLKQKGLIAAKIIPVNLLHRIFTGFSRMTNKQKI